MGASGFIERLVKYDKDNIPAKCVEAVEGLIKNDENPLDPELLQKFGRVWAAFAMWAMAMIDYHHASKAVDPHEAGRDFLLSCVDLNEGSVHTIM